MSARRWVALTVLSAALPLATVLPAAAAPPNDTVTTFALTGGLLNVVPAPTAALGSVTASANAQTVSGSLGPVLVTDARGSTAAWTVSAASTTFSGLLGGASSTAVNYNSGPITVTSGTVIPTSAGTKPLSGTAVPVVTTSGVLGVNSATFSPTLSVNMPAGALTDTYTGTVTTSVA